MRALWVAISVPAIGCFPGPLPPDTQSDDTATETSSADVESDLSPLGDSDGLTTIISDSSTANDIAVDTSAPDVVTCPSPCDDNDPCNGIETCGSDGTCVPGESVVCSVHANPCRENVCSQQTGTCVSQDKLDGVECDDGALCTGNDECESGECIGTGLPDDASDWNRIESDFRYPTLTQVGQKLLGVLTVTRPETITQTASGTPMVLEVAPHEHRVYRLELDSAGLVSRKQAFASVVNDTNFRLSSNSWLLESEDAALVANWYGAVQIGSEDSLLLDELTEQSPVARAVIAVTDGAGTYRWHRIYLADSPVSGGVPVVAFGQAGEYLVAGLGAGGRVVGRSGEPDFVYPEPSGAETWITRFDQSGLLVGADVLFSTPQPSPEAMVSFAGNGDAWTTTPVIATVRFGSGATASEVAVVPDQPTWAIGRSTKQGAVRWVRRVRPVVSATRLAFTSAGGSWVAMAVDGPELVVGDEADAQTFSIDSGYVVVEFDPLGEVKAIRPGMSQVLERTDGIIGVVTTIGAFAPTTDGPIWSEGSADVLRTFLVHWGIDGAATWFKQVASVPHMEVVPVGSTSLAPMQLLAAPDGTPGVILVGQSDGELTVGTSVVSQQSGVLSFLSRLDSSGGLECDPSNTPP